MNDREELLLQAVVDQIVEAFEACSHKTATHEWCHLCGAVRNPRISDVWLKPAWRLILEPACREMYEAGVPKGEA